MQYRGSFPRDANHIPDVSHGCLQTDIQTLVANNTTVDVPIFTVQGSVEVLGLWGIVTTLLGNNTAAYWRFNDQTNQSNITLNTGTTLTAAPVGSAIVKKGLAAAALVLLSASQEQVSEPTTLETTYFSPFVLNALPSATTNVEFVYSTTDTPTTGVIQFFMRWLPLSVNAQVLSL